MKILKMRKLTASDQDKHTLRLLRQEVTLNDQMKKLGLIDDKEYKLTAERISKTVLMLEAKYGL